MRLIDNWQYRYIEKCLYAYHEMELSSLPTDIRMVEAIGQALTYFKGTDHEKMLEDFYFIAHTRSKHHTVNKFFLDMCEKNFISNNIGYSIRREIVYRVSMNCYALGILKLGGHKNDN